MYLFIYRFHPAQLIHYSNITQRTAFSAALHLHNATGCSMHHHLRLNKRFATFCRPVYNVIFLWGAEWRQMCNDHVLIRLNGEVEWKRAGGNSGVPDEIGLNICLFSKFDLAIVVQLFS